MPPHLPPSNRVQKYYFASANFCLGLLNGVWVDISLRCHCSLECESLPHYSPECALRCLVTDRQTFCFRFSIVWGNSYGIYWECRSGKVTCDFKTRKWPSDPSVTGPTWPMFHLARSSPNSLIIYPSSRKLCASVGYPTGPKFIHESIMWNFPYIVSICFPCWITNKDNEKHSQYSKQCTGKSKTLCYILVNFKCT